MFRAAFALAALCVATACSQAPAAERDASLPDAAHDSAALDDLEIGRVCRAAMAALFGRDVTVMVVEQVHAGAADIRSLRAEDTLRNRCRPTGGVIEWAGIDVYGPGTGLGRWRTDPEDGRISFETDGDHIAVTQLHFDGSRSVHEYVIAR